MRVRVTAAFTLALLFLAAARGQAQMPLPPPGPPPGFVPPFEIMRTVRSAGFDPVAPPLREGTTYVLHATDFRGILMRVVVDANTGVIRAANRIVPGPGPFGQVGMVAPLRGEGPDDMMPPSGAPPDLSGTEMSPYGARPMPPPPFVPHPPATRPRATVTVLPPLPRPRPAEIASRKPADEVKPEIAPSTSASKPDLKSETKPDVKSDVTTAAPAPPSAKPGKTPPGPPIND